eukprot:SAG22_NODE_4423_length_1273_cov_1.853492_2_plen_65_part_00
MCLDLDEVVHMSTNKVWLMEFLLRRRGSKRWVCTLLLDSMVAGALAAQDWSNRGHSDYSDIMRI